MTFKVSDNHNVGFCQFLATYIFWFLEAKIWPLSTKKCYLSQN